MSRDKSLTGVASVGDQGIALDSPNTDTITVPDGSIWFVDGVFVDGEEPIRSAIIVDPDNTSPQATSLWSQATDFSGPYSVFESDGTVYVADRDGGSVDALVTTALSSASRSTRSIGSTELGEYAYGGDTIAVGVNLPQQSVGYRLGVREVVSQ